MFERFTERARRVIILAREEAGRFRHDFVGTEHILLGLIRDGEGIATAVLQRLGLRLETVKSEVERALRTIDGVQNAYVTNVSGPTGERVGAAVVCGSELTPERLSASARKLLSSFKVPTLWLLLRSDDDVRRERVV